MNSALRLLCLLAGGLAAAARLAAEEYPRIEPPIESALARIVEEVSGLHADPDWQCRTFDLVDRHLGGHFNWRRSSRAILRDNWPDDPAGQDRFVDAFYNYLVAQWGDLLIHFNPQTLRVFQQENAPESARSTLETEVTFTDGSQYRVGLVMWFSDDAWRIIDVVAETYSYVAGFHEEYRFEIREVGFDGLIRRLEEEAAPRRQCGQ